MREVYFDRAKTSYAKSWNELSNDQLLATMRILHGKNDWLRKLEQLAHVICNLKSNEKLFITADDCHHLCHFVIAEEAILTKNLLPKIRAGKKWLYGPADSMGNASFGEFITADTFCMNYLKTKNNEWLDKMIACLYRPKKKPYRPAHAEFDGDIREKFNANNLESRLEAIEELDNEIKQAILLFFLGCKQGFANQYDSLFVKGGNPEASGSWLEVLSAYAQGIAQYDAVLESNVGLVFFEVGREMHFFKPR